MNKLTTAAVSAAASVLVYMVLDAAVPNEPQTPVPAPSTTSVATIPSPPVAKQVVPQKTEPQQNWAPVEEPEPEQTDDKVIVSPNAENPSVADVKPAPNMPSYKPQPTVGATP